MKQNSIESILKKIKQLKRDVADLQLSKKSNPRKHFPSSLKELYGDSEPLKTVTEEEKQLLTQFFIDHSEHIQSLMEDDVGSSVIGEGIVVYVLKPRHKKPERQYVFYNIFTQTDQPKALKAAIKMAEKAYPELKGAIEYEAGNLD